MVVSDGFATLMVIVGFTRVKEVAFTLKIVGAAGGGGGIVNVAETPVDASLVPTSLIALILNV